MKGSTSTPAPDADTLEGAFEAMRAEIEGLAAKRVLPARVDAFVAAAVAQSVAVRDADKAERRAEFERLAAAGFYDLGLIDRVARLARAMLYARHRQIESAGTATSERVPKRVVLDARQLRETMLRVLEYWLGGDAKIASELAYLRRGAGHLDLASDLRLLADLYERREVRAALAADRTHYRASDARAARELAETIIEGLGLRGPAEKARWRDLAHRTWTLLFHAYEDHRAAGVFVFRKREDVGKTYPSLVSSARAKPSRKAPG